MSSSLHDTIGLVLRSEIETMLLLWPLVDVLDRIGVHHLKFAFTEDDPYHLGGYTDELAWLDKHLICDDEGVLLRVR